MLTLLLAWINAKYNGKYDLLFFGTFLLDVHIIDFVAQLIIK